MIFEFAARLGPSAQYGTPDKAESEREKAELAGKCRTAVQNAVQLLEWGRGTVLPHNTALKFETKRDIGPLLLVRCFHSVK
jgi:hypothetical protein